MPDTVPVVLPCRMETWTPMAKSEEMIEWRCPRDPSIRATLLLRQIVLELGAAFHGVDDLLLQGGLEVRAPINLSPLDRSESSRLTARGFVSTACLLARPRRRSVPPRRKGGIRGGGIALSSSPDPIMPSGKSESFLHCQGDFFETLGAWKNRFWKENPRHLGEI